MTFDRLLKPLFFLLFVITIVQYWFFSPVVFADASRGFEAMEQYMAGGNWNSVSYPVVGGDYQYFLSWWTPGQWVFPFLLIKIGVGMNTALQLITTVALSVSIFGYYRLFRILDFSSVLVWGSLITIVTNQLFYWHTIMYYGGDLLLLALFPYFVLFLLKLRKSVSLLNLCLLFVYILIGFFLKSSFLVISWAGVGSFILIWLLQGDKRNRKWTLYLIPLLTATVVIYIFFLAKGETPGSTIRSGAYNHLTHDLFGDLFYALGSPVGIMTRFFPAIQKVIANVGVNLNFLAILGCIASGWLLIRFFTSGSEDRKQVILFSGLFFAAMTFLFLSDRAVSYDMRHFAPFAFLLTPFMLEWCISVRWKKLFLSVLIVLNLADFALFPIYRYKVEHTHEMVGEIKMKQEDAEIVRRIYSGQTENNRLVIIQDYWLLSHYMREPSICLSEQNGDWIVNSGMEEIHKEKMDWDILSSYHAVIFVSRNSGELPVELQKRVQKERVEISNGYTIFLLTPIKD